ncbi:GatB/YqeY domain-containing protein [Lentilactobacillus sp. Marseille-Q4993]|uniref:GatB/YqeY domain-containing protein n=1 Tax=Lentilactobacillus sp. Marseille-Q4993 TaxID=3039492 RepID=UPI0024BCF3A1|nr:GatB/YqeY domain-containing protein [Lentilactobacillus sp. Marseille-Q4993]
MSLYDQLNSDLKEAMKAKDKIKLGVIRGLKSQITNAEVENGNEKLTDAQITEIISRELKQQHESIDEFEKAGRDDLVSGQKEKLAIVEGYAPKQLSESEVEDIVKETIAEVGAESMADFGNVMKAIMPKVKGQADGSVVNKFVKAQLSK